ncbi:MAG: hypothetical protein WAX29_07555, partial [Propionibacterium sp.]
RFQFLDPTSARSFWGDQSDRMNHDAVAILRAEAGRNPYDKALSNLVGELSTRSEDFRRLWANHDVRYHRSGTKTFHHPAVGTLQLDYKALVLPGDTGLQVNVYTAPIGSPSHDGLTLLASWASDAIKELPLPVEAMERCGNRRPRVARLVSAWNQGIREGADSAGELDGRRIGVSAEPKKRPRTRLTDKEVDAMRTAREQGAGVNTLARQFGVHRGTVWAKIRRTTG